MSESKELLEATIKGLEDKLKSVTDDLNTKNRELVEEAVDSVSINEDDLEYSMEFDYDNKVCLNDISLDNSDAFAEKVMCAIDGHYKMVDTQVTNATYVEKVI